MIFGFISTIMTTKLGSGYLKMESPANAVQIGQLICRAVNITFTYYASNCKFSKKKKKGKAE